MATPLARGISMSWTGRGSVPSPSEHSRRETLMRSTGQDSALSTRKTSMNSTEQDLEPFTRGTSTNLTDHDLELSTRETLMKLTRSGSELSIDILNELLRKDWFELIFIEIKRRCWPVPTKCSDHEMFAVPALEMSLPDTPLHMWEENTCVSILWCRHPSWLGNDWYGDHLSVLISPISSSTKLYHQTLVDMSLNIQSSVCLLPRPLYYP